MDSVVRILPSPPQPQQTRQSLPQDSDSFIEYLRLVFGHWRLLVLGLTFAVILLFLDLVPDKRIKFEIIAVIFVVFFGWAAFQSMER